eukprot:TRINITY_DN1934_c0_g1_i8.p2 TRINITY_DN1934_c0_g1~~TRINITY_DN1934_c0_g1_i8.p2  ORF type:complete len:258 (+),score=25.26 TRINITY_DN1934_c0_g1_i8:209-982(+)
MLMGRGITIYFCQSLCNLGAPTSEHYAYQFPIFDIFPYYQRFRFSVKKMTTQSALVFAGLMFFVYETVILLSYAGPIPAIIRLIKSKDASSISRNELLLTYYTYAVWAINSKLNGDKLISFLVGPGALAYFIYVTIYLVRTKQAKSIFKFNLPVVIMVFVLYIVDSVTIYLLAALLLLRFLASANVIREAAALKDARAINKFEIITTMMSTLAWGSLTYFAGNLYYFVPFAMGHLIYWGKLAVNLKYKTRGGERKRR